MDNYRREQNVNLLNQVKASYDEKHPPSVPLSFKKSEFLVDNPKHRSMSEIQEIRKKEARIKNGLSAVANMYVTRQTDDMIPSLKFDPFAQGK